MNCSELDAALEDAHALVIDSDGGFVVASGSLVVASLVLLVLGERLARPLGAAVAGAVAAVAGFVFTRAGELPCAARLAIAGTACVLAAVLALCLFKTGLFVLGAAGFGTVAHYVYAALPLDGVEPPFVVLHRSGYYYLAVGTAATAGGIATQCQRAHVVRISSALVGGGGLAYATHLVADRAGADVPALVLLATLVLSTVAGVALQCRFTRPRGRGPRGTRHRPASQA